MPRFDLLEVRADEPDRVAVETAQFWRQLVVLDRVTVTLASRTSPRCSGDVLQTLFLGAIDVAAQEGIELEEGDRARLELQRPDEGQ